MNEMKDQLRISILCLFITTILFFSCKDENSLIIEESDNCNILFISNNLNKAIEDEEREIMEECLSMRINSASQLKENLIGAWKIMGYGSGVGQTLSHPCGNLTVTVDKLILHYKDQFIDTITIHNWQVESGNNGYPYLEISPRFIRPIYLHIFCSRYMYGDNTPIDGDMYLFEKEE